MLFSKIFLSLAFLARRFDETDELGYHMNDAILNNQAVLLEVYIILNNIFNQILNNGKYILSQQTQEDSKGPCYNNFVRIR